MKNLRAIIEKSHQNSIGRVYFAESYTNERMISGTSFIDLQWGGHETRDFHTTIEQKSLIQGNTTILNNSNRVINLEMEIQDLRSERLCLIKCHSHYYTIHFVALDHEYERIKNFLITYFHVFMSTAKLNQYGKSFTYFLEGLNESDNTLHPKLTITLVNRYAANLMPFLTIFQKRQVMKNLINIQKDKNGNNLKYESQEYFIMNSNYLGIEKTEMNIKEQQMVPDENLMLAQSRMHDLDSVQITEKASDISRQQLNQSIESIFKPSQHQILQKNQDQFIEVKNPSTSAKLIKGKKDPRIRFSVLREANYLSSSAKLKKVKLLIESHTIDEGNRWTFKIQKMGENVYLTEQELIYDGFADEIKTYKQTLPSMNEINQEIKE